MTESNKKLNSDDRQKALKEAFVKEIREELASDHSGKPSFEDFKKAVEKDRASRRKRRTAIAACFAVALLVSFFAFDMLASDVGADKNPKETIVTEDGVIIEDGGYGSSEYEDDVWITEDWNHVGDAKELYPQLLVPKYIPEKYSFYRLKIHRVINEDFVCEYLFKNNNEVLEIEILATKGGEIATNVEGTNKKVMTTKGTLYINVENKTAIIQMAEGIVINIWHNVSEKELVSIVDNLI